MMYVPTIPFLHSLLSLDYFILVGTYYEYIMSRNCPRVNFLIILNINGTVLIK